MAYLDFGIWSLIAYYFSSAVITSVAMLLTDRWWPGPSFSLRRAKELFSYGWKMLVSAVLCSLYADIRTLIVGKRWSEEELGYYNRGQQFPEVLSNTLDNAIQSVMFPVLSRSQDDRAEMKRILRRTATLSSLLVMPAMIGMAVAAEPFVLAVLTEKWLPAVPFMQILALGNLTLSLTSSNLVAIKSTGKSGTYMILELIRRLAMLAVLLLSVFVFGTVETVAWGFVVSSVLDALIIAVPTHRILGYSLLEQCRDLWRILLASLLMGGAILPLLLLPCPPVAILLAQIALGVAVYVGAGFLLRIPAMRELLSMAKRLLRRGKTAESQAGTPPEA
jgi:O-antigen/teichoic acid export membrane protein